MRNPRWFPDAWHGAKVLWEHRLADRRHDTDYRDTSNVSDLPASGTAITSAYEGDTRTDPPLSPDRPPGPVG